MPKNNQHFVDTMNSALSESGIVCLHNIDQPLVTDLCEIIGAMHRALTARGVSDAEIEKIIFDECPL